MQGGVAVLLQRLNSIVDKQPVNSDFEEEHDTDSCQSSSELSEGEQRLDETSPDVDDPRCNEEEGTQKLK